jgi:mono/diheme cytochrome c family protein
MFQKRFIAKSLMAFLALGTIVSVPIKMAAAWDATPTTASAPYTNLSTPAQRGRWLWLKNNCMGCHGDRAGGGMGPNIVGESGELAQVLAYGEGGGMPAFKWITSSQVSELGAYLQSIQSNNDPKFICWYTNTVNDLNYDGTGERPGC